MAHQDPVCIHNRRLTVSCRGCGRRVTRVPMLCFRCLGCDAIHEWEGPGRTFNQRCPDCDCVMISLRVIMKEKIQHVKIGVKETMREVVRLINEKLGR